MTTLESSPLHPEQQQEAAVQGQLEVHDFGRGQLLRYHPTEVRLDESTRGSALPLLYFQGVNGDETLPLVLQTLGDRDKRPIIGIRYTGKLKGTDKPLTPEHKDYVEGNVVPEIEMIQADDALAALDVLGVKKVDALASSRGGLRCLLSIRKRPEAFRHVYGDDIAGQDGRGYIETHMDAAWLALSRKFMGRSMLSNIIDPTPRPRRERVKRSIRDLRIEQRSAGRAQFGHMLADLGSIKEGEIRIGSDKRDRAFRTKNVRAIMRQTGADQYVQLIETDKGGHGIGISGRAIDNAISQLREMERKAAQDVKG